MKDPSLQIYADLHTHSNASDGDLSPQELFSKALSCGISSIALTDHDTLSGISYFLESGHAPGLEVVPGIEISAEYEHGMLHILGYFARLPEGLEEELEEVQEARRRRIPRIIEKLNYLGIMITQGDVMPASPTAQLGRPHVARAMLKKGYVRSLDEAFREYIGKGRKAYVPKEKMPWEKALSLITRYRGLTVLAHPYTLGLDNDGLAAFVSRLKDAGLAGIEINYPEHSPEQISFYSYLASKSGLIVTGGTDFHGPGRNGLSPGEYGLTAEQFSTFRERLCESGENRS